MDREMSKPHYAKADIAIRICQSLVQFTLYHSVASLISSALTVETARIYIRMGILLLPLIIFSLARAYVKNIFVFMAIHLLVSGGLLFVFPERMPETVAMAMALIMMVINSVHFRIVESYKYKECPHLMMLGIIFVVYWFATYAERELMANLCYYEILAFLFFYMISTNLENTEKFIKLNEDTANFPIEQMKGVNQILLVFFAIIFLGGLLIVPHLHLEEIAQQLGQWLLEGTRWFFSHFDWSDSVNYQAVEDVTQNTPSGGFFLMEPGEASKVALFFEQVFKILVGIAVVVVVLFGIAYGLYQIYQNFYKTTLHTSEDQKNRGVETIAENIPIFQRKKEGEEEAIGINKKIRKYYKKSVKKRKGRQTYSFSAMTPREIEEWLKQEVNEHMGETEKVLRIYEKARYGKEECSKEDLEEIRSHL